MPAACGMGIALATLAAATSPELPRGPAAPADCQPTLPTLRYQPPARVNCAFAQRLVRFEKIVDEEARTILGIRMRAIVQLGTYNCRRMAAYPDLVSEHSFANAIDVGTFILANGRRVEVERGAAYTVDGP